jgi:hypothetical protein
MLTATSISVIWIIGDVNKALIKPMVSSPYSFAEAAG